MIITCWIFMGFVFASVMTSPGKRFYTDITSINGYTVRNVHLETSDGKRINAWIAGNSADKAVILLSGIRSPGRFMMARAYIYLREGYTVMMPDLRGTGRSDGDCVTFGWQEREDLIAAYHFLKEQGIPRIAVHGVSLGAATIAYSLDSISDYSFVVMESCYDNIDHALEHRTFNSGFNRLLMWPAYFFAEEKIGADADQLYPINYVRKYKGPLLYFAGDRESQIPLQETVEIFNNFGSRNRTLHVFEGATHQDLLKFSPKVYEEELTVFLHSLK